MSTTTTPAFTTGIASEASHWYDKDGNPAYDVPNESKAVKCTVCTGSLRSAAAKAVTAACSHCDAEGWQYPEMRPATLRDAKKLDNGHSVTGVTRVVANYNIVAYQLQQLEDACATATPETEALRHTALDLWRKQVRFDAAQHASQAAATGNNIHATIERGIRGESLVGYQYAAWFDAFKLECEKMFGCWPMFEAEKSFTNRRLGYGCKVDALGFYATAEGRQNILIDTKTKDIEKLDKMPKAWDAEIMQLAANREAAKMPTARCFNAFTDRKEPVVFFVEADEPALRRGWVMFQHCLAIKQLQDNYRPSWCLDGPLLQA